MNNEEFDKLPAKCKRMAVAEDVLLQIDSGKIAPRKMTYITLLDFDYSQATKSSDVTELLSQPQAACKACALGALAVSNFLRTGNRCPLSPMQDELHESLQGVFTSDQLYLIESAFEKNDFTRDNAYDRDGEKVISERAERAVKFGMRYSSDESRLRAIMQNILENDGEFVP